MEINVSYTYVSKRSTEKHRVPGGTHSTQDTLLFRAHSHSHPRLLRLGQFKYTSSLNCTSLGCGRKLESPEKTYTDRENMPTLHREWPSQELIVFLINFMITWCWMKWCYLRSCMHFKYLTILFVDYIQYIWKKKEKRKCRNADVILFNKFSDVKLISSIRGKNIIYSFVSNPYYFSKWVGGKITKIR